MSKDRDVRAECVSASVECGGGRSGGVWRPRAANTSRRDSSRGVTISCLIANPMAPSRSARHPPAQLSLYADGSSSESDFELTPRQRAKSQKIRKRVSETQDKSFTEDANPGRMPLKTVNINDDSAEKRRRRKSAKNPSLDNAEAGPSISARQDDSEDHPHSRHKQALKSIIVETPIIDVPINIRHSNYEEWMKMAMDNVSPPTSKPLGLLILLP
jgi:hypothetical protein